MLASPIVSAGTAQLPSTKRICWRPRRTHTGWYLNAGEPRVKSPKNSICARVVYLIPQLSRTCLAAKDTHSFRHSVQGR